jgi:hypothetical protein
VQTFTVKTRGVTVGWSDLERQDEAAGVAAGALRPGPGYDLVQPIFQLYAEAGGDGARPADEAKLARYHAARERLGLTLHAPSGAELPADAIHVLDHTAREGPEALEVEVRLSDPAAWARLGRARESR